MTMTPGLNRSWWWGWMPDPSWYSPTGSLMTLELGFRDAYNLEECTWGTVQWLSCIHVDKQRQKVWKENDKADMQRKGHMFLKVERRLKRGREIEKEGERRGGRGKSRENENGKLASWQPLRSDSSKPRESPVLADTLTQDILKNLCKLHNKKVFSQDNYPLPFHGDLPRENKKPT